MGASCDVPRKKLAEKIEDYQEAYTVYAKKVDRIWNEVEDEGDGQVKLGLREKMHKQKQIAEDVPEGVDYTQHKEDLFHEAVKGEIQKARDQAIQEAHEHHGHEEHGVGTDDFACRRGGIGGIPDPEVAFLGHRAHVAIAGKLSEAPEEQFQLKGTAMHGLANIEELTEDNLAGVRSIRGVSPVLHRANQDDFFYVGTADNYRIMGVMDGHGEFGAEAAAMVRDSIMRTLLAEVPFERARKTEDMKDYAEQLALALKDAFKAAHEELVHQTDVDVRLSGVCACVVVHDVKYAWLHVAWVGNCRAVIADLQEEEPPEGQKKGQGRKNLTATPLTADHNTRNHQERERCEKAGAQFVPSKYDDEMCIPGEKFPGIPITRCMGNKVAHCIGVTHEPAVHNRPMIGDGKEARFIVLGTDGLYDVVRNSEIVITIHELRKGNLEYALEHVEAKAKENWMKKAVKMGNTIDDCTIGLLYLHGFEIAKDDDLEPEY